MNFWRSRTIRGIGAILAVTLAAGVWRGTRILAIGVAYKAKMLCSGAFVSRRDPAMVLADLQVGDLSILRYIGTSVDIRTRSVTASGIGIVTRRAVYRDGLGCALALDGMVPPAQPANGATVVAPERREGGGGPPGWQAATGDSESGALNGVIDSAFSEPYPERPRRSLAVVVVHRGRIVAERYAAGIEMGTPLIGWSMTKSIMNALVGVLVRQGRLRIGEPAPIPEWHQPGDPRGAITTDHLLRMSSGLRFDEGMENPRSDVMRMLFDVGDAARFAARHDLAAPPGTRWQYSSGTSNIIARAIRNTLRDDSRYLAFPRRTLFDPLGMEGAVLETDAAGTFVGSSYMYATARDWAKFGMLYLQDGLWSGQRILPEGWVSYSRSPAPADSTKRYGAHFWLAVPDEYCATGNRLPPDAFHAAGHEGQFVTVVPSRDAVIVRLGRTRIPEAWDHCAFVRDVTSVLDRVRY